MMHFHSWMISNLLILAVNEMLSILSINPFPWSTIIVMMKTLFMYVIKNAQVHHLIFQFIMKTLL